MSISIDGTKNGFKNGIYGVRPIYQKASIFCAIYYYVRCVMHTIVLFYRTRLVNMKCISILSSCRRALVDLFVPLSAFSLSLNRSSSLPLSTFSCFCSIIFAWNLSKSIRAGFPYFLCCHRVAIQVDNGMPSMYDVLHAIWVSIFLGYCLFSMRSAMWLLFAFDLKGKILTSQMHCRDFALTATGSPTSNRCCFCAITLAPVGTEKRRNVCRWMNEPFQGKSKGEKSCK